MTPFSFSRASSLLGGASLLAMGVALGFASAPGSASAAIFSQCPGDLDGDSIIDVPDPTRQVKCVHLAAGDGFINMPDIDPATGERRRLYTFGFSNMTGVPTASVPTTGQLNANFPGPRLVFDEGDEVYLTLSNVGMIMRPDLFDPHTVHFHGFPNASAIFDGLPESGVAINQVASLTYYYNIVEPGTYMYHCHVEAAEHMQMGMLGALYVRPAQDQTTPGVSIGGYVHQEGDRYVFNDGDGSTVYQVDAPLQMGSMDPAFHDASEAVQPLPFAEMEDRYTMLNGRAYPDTINSEILINTFDGRPTQQSNALIEAVQGQKILLRISNLNITGFYTLSSPTLPMKVVGNGGRIYRGGALADGPSLYYETNSVTLGGGEAIDAIIDTSNAPPGTYVLQTPNFNFLTNDEEDYGGMMTEIVITAAN